jgi:hypothetical protein
MQKITAFPRIEVYHDKGPGGKIEEIPTVNIPESDFLMDACLSVLELISARMAAAPTDRNRQILDQSAEAFFQAMGV